METEKGGIQSKIGTDRRKLARYVVEKHNKRIQRGTDAGGNNGKMEEENEGTLATERKLKATVKQVTADMMKNIVDEPERFWEVMRNMRNKEQAQDIPGYMKTAEENEMEGGEKEVAQMWIDTFHRKNMNIKHKRGKHGTTKSEMI